MASVIVDVVPPRARSARTPFYVGVSLFIVVTVLAGFAPSFYLLAVDGRPRPWILHLHAAIYLGWLALLVAQAVLAARGKIALHRRLGTLIAVWFLPIVAGMVYDTYSRRRVHPVYWIGAAVMGMSLLRIPFGEAELWHGIGRPLLKAFI